MLWKVLRNIMYTVLYTVIFSVNVISVLCLVALIIGILFLVPDLVRLIWD